MDEETFTAQTLTAGCAEVCRVQYKPHHATTEHTHEFTAHGLILSGEFTLTTRDRARVMHQGDAFSLTAGTPHFETVGPDGAELSAGRAYPTAAGEG
ncbi:MAG: cupin domain-containing protein [Gammaproteobacteria bacterium]